MSENFSVALQKAVAWHADQMRKSTHIPYVSHLLAVASLVLEDGGSEAEAIAGLLHDSMEDQGISGEEIRGLFGAEVARIVEACSELRGPPKPPWLERKLHHLHTLHGADDKVLRVTAADKLHNCRTVVADVRIDGAGALNRFRGGIAGTCWYYGAMTGLLEGEFPGSKLTADLGREARTLHEFAGVTFPAPQPSI